MWLYGSGFPKAQDIGKAIDKRAGKTKKYTYHKHKHADTRAVKSSGNHTTPYCIECDANMTYPPQQCDRLCNAKQPPIDSEWAGYKTALKPAHEPIVMARKPFKGSTIDNVLEHGVGALNIDESRIDWDPGEQEKEQVWRERYMKKNVGGPTFQETSIYEQKKGGVVEDAPQGRFPSNVIGEVEDYQKFFYCPKVSRKERHCGFEQDNVPPNKDYMVEAMGGTWVDKNMIDLPHIGKIYVHGLRDEYDKWLKKDPLAHIPAPFGQIQGAYVDGERMAKVADDTQYAAKGNDHPTVKPSSLMKYLIKLVTPPNSKVLDPFMGSGSTGMACVELGHEFTGIELDKHYCEIAEKRIEGWKKLKSTELFVEE
jgi:site-specific DNA-methyltransferase (adenine-specific)